MNHNHTLNHGHDTGHLVLMLLCCLIPIALIAAVAVFGFSLGVFTPYLPIALVLLCPLMMFFMMRGMQHDAADIEHAETSALQNANSTRNVPTDAAMNREN